MINKRFDQIDKADIEDLVNNEVSESRTLEYKQELPSNSDSDKKEFLADISSFANAAGGDILYGIVEKRDGNGKPTGLPEKAQGIDFENIDQEIQRLLSIIRDGVEPRIPGAQIKPIEGVESGSIVFIRIPKSWISPHMVTYKNSSRFYSRTSAGKYQLDVSEIRSAFSFSEELPNKIRRFRDERIARIIADETPVPLRPTGKIVLHLVPIDAFTSIRQIDLVSHYNILRGVTPLGATGHNSRYNIDGILNFNCDRDESNCNSYAQVFRNSIIETVSSDYDNNIIPSQAYEEEIIQAFDKYIEITQQLECHFPYFILTTMVGVKGYEMGVGSSSYPHRFPRPIDRDVLLLPDVVIEDMETELTSLLRDLFNAVWQAAGYPRSFNYDEGEKWVGQKIKAS